MIEEISLAEYIKSLAESVKAFEAYCVEHKEVFPETLTKGDWEDQFTTWLSTSEEEKQK